MKSYRELLGFNAKDENIWLIDRYQMGRLKLSDYYIRDQFSEERGPHGHVRVYFWQHRGEDGCTVKVHASITESGEVAHEAMKHFISHLPDPSAFSIYTEDIGLSHWFSKTEAEKVHYVHSGTEQHAAILVWGNIFFHIESVGEQTHSILSFLDNLGENWLHLQEDTEHQPDFELTTNKTTLHAGEEAVLINNEPENHTEFCSFMYVAGPKNIVQLYRENDTFKLKLTNPLPEALETLAKPFAMLVGVKPNGRFIKSNRLVFEYGSE